MKKILVGLLSLSLLFLIGCAKGPSTQKDKSKPIIKVNNSVITEKMFNDVIDKQMNSPMMGMKLDEQSKKSNFFYLSMKKGVVNELIVRQLLNQEIEKRNIKVSDEELNKTIEDIKKQVGGDRNFFKVLKERGLSEAEFKSTLTNDLKIKKMVDSLSYTKVSEAQAKQFYEKNKASKFTYPDMVRAKHILFLANEEEIKNQIKADNPKATNEEINVKTQAKMDEIKAKALRVLADVKANTTRFDQYAQKYSEDVASAKNGGDLGFFKKEEMVPEFSKVAFSTRPGTVSEVVKTPFGYHIILVVDRKKAGVTPFSEVKNDIIKYLEDKNKIEVLQKLIEGLKAEAKIEYIDPSYNPDNIQKQIEDALKKSGKDLPPAQKQSK